MKRVLLSFVLFLAAAVCFGQEQKAVAFGLFGKDKEELKKMNRRLVFTFENGYARPQWEPGKAWGQCRNVEVRFYDLRWDSDFLSLLDAPEGELIRKGETKVMAGDVVVMTLDTPDQDYNLNVIGKKGEYIEIVRIFPVNTSQP